MADDEKTLTLVPGTEHLLRKCVDILAQAQQSGLPASIKIAALDGKPIAQNTPVIDVRCYELEEAATLMPPERPARKSLEIHIVGQDQSTDPALVETVIRIAQTMASNEGDGPFSTGEFIAGALLNGRMDWLPESYRHPLDAIDRLGPTWLQAVEQAHRLGRDARPE
ncbi:hypothetical protein AWL63_23495 (plasmid) [Sphingomonas panacis]|uniref:Uncharacterized protein n=1 Tax=Sphingomonas panacis TaxID=1560345 RepID=A0A1B3ZI85_9SPHN|nr:hypothetical protein [Sphingomonas panacis]AOH87140.1 hypothetical protein AWL63_23495 [Sphingomonas panacis]